MFYPCYRFPHLVNISFNVTNDLGNAMSYEKTILCTTSWYQPSVLTLYPNFLGLYLNSKLNWDTHINVIGKKISRAVGIQ